jgi:carbon-monoxide dehydrogenase medium subunit
MTEVCRAQSVAEAVALLAEPGTVPLAGATWVMRGASRAARYVVLAGLDTLREVTREDATLVIGALVTHAELAALDGPRALVEAAAASAFPAVRNVATLGGNLCADGFAEADLVPALLALGAVVRVASVDGERRVPVADFMPDGGLVTAVEVPAVKPSAFERLTVRGAGEYAVASVAVCAERGGGSRGVRIAVGGVEARPKLCPAASAALLAGADAGRALATECTGRDGPGAPGWYREAVLPALLERAVARLEGS